MISKRLSTSRKFARAGLSGGEFAQLLYPLLVIHADDFGRQSGDSFTVKHQVFPTSPRGEDEFDAALNVLTTEGLILRYETPEAVQVIQIVEFERHQSGLNKRTSSEFPGISGNFQEIPSELNRTELKRTEPNGTEQIPRAAQIVSPKEFAKRQERSAFVSDRFDVPFVLHREFVGRYGKDAEPALQAWYQSVHDGLGDDESVPDVFPWLRARFNAWLPSTGRVHALPTMARVSSARSAPPVDANQYVNERQARIDAETKARG